MKNQLEKKMENEMETGVIIGYMWGYVGVILGLYWVYIGIMEKKTETTGSNMGNR